MAGVEANGHVWPWMALTGVYARARSTPAFQSRDRDHPLERRRIAMKVVTVAEMVAIEQRA